MSLLDIEEIQTYYGQSHVLHGVSMSIDEGETVALMGRNGAGKTTTMRSIIGLTPPRSGTITFKGDRISGKEPFQIANAGIGYVPEDRRVFPDLTVQDNIEILVKKDSEWSLDRVFDLFPKLDERSGQLGKQLSGGEQQMLSIARALVTDPDLLFLDEPSEGLAPIIVQDLRKILREIGETGITVLIAEQNVNFAFDLTERGYILSKGQMVWEGTIDELQDNEEMIETHLGVSAMEAEAD